MVFMAMRKPSLMPRWRSPHSGGSTGPSRKAFCGQLIFGSPRRSGKPLIADRGKGWQVDPISCKHDRVAAADGPAAGNRGVNADVHCVVLSSRAEDS
jgi:hypothetical protein